MKKLLSLLFLVCTLMLLTTTFASCKDEKDDENSEKPVTPVTPSDYQTVSAAGGTIEKGDISITFPSGTFSKDEQVALTDIAAETVLSSETCSEFYRVTLPSTGTQRSIKLSLKCDGKPEEAEMVLQTMGYNVHGDGTLETYIVPLESVVKDGRLETEIVPLDDAEGEDIFFTVGLVSKREDDPSSARSTRADEDDDPRFSVAYQYGLGLNPKMKEWWTSSFDARYFAYRNLMVDAVKELLPEVFDVLKSVGYEMIPHKLNYQITLTEKQGNEITHGFYNSSMFCTEWGVVQISVQTMYKYVAEGNVSELDGLKATLIHETLHAIYDQVYDKRPAHYKFSEGVLGLNDWQVLDEAVGCWSEKFIASHKVNTEVTPANARHFLSSFYAAPRSFSNNMIVGYGMAIFIEYLSQLTSNADIVKLYEWRRNEKSLGSSMVLALGDLYDKKGIYEGNKYIFCNEGYRKFVEDFIKGFSPFLDVNANSGSFFTTVTKLQTLRFTNDIRNFGSDVNTVIFSSKVTDSLDVYSAEVSHASADLVTYVYGGKDLDMKIGEASAAAPLKISCKDIKGKYKGRICLATFRNNNNGGEFYRENTPVKNDVTVKFTKVEDETIKAINGVSMELKFRYQDNSNDHIYNSSIGYSGFNHGCLEEENQKVVFTLDGSTLHITSFTNYSKDNGPNYTYNYKGQLNFDIVNYGDRDGCKVQDVKYEYRADGVTHGTPGTFWLAGNKLVEMSAELTNIKLKEKAVYEDGSIYLKFVTSVSKGLDIQSFKYHAVEFVGTEHNYTLVDDSNNEVEMTIVVQPK